MFVADFLGVSNLMQVTARCADGRGRCRVRLDNFELQAARGGADIVGETKATIRPERIRLEPQGATGENRLPGMVERWVYLGNAVQLIVRLATGQAIQVLIQNTGDEIPYTQGTPVQVHFPADALRVLTGMPGPPGNAISAAGRTAD